MQARRYLIVLAILSSGAAAAAELPPPFLRAELGPDEIPYEMFSDGAPLIGGRRDVWPGAPDFFLRMKARDAVYPLSEDGTPKLYARSGIFSDKGDAPDLALRRAGPDNSPPTGEPAALAPGTAIGALYWQAWGGLCRDSKHQFGFFAGCGNNGRTAEIYSRAVGEQTGSSRAGSLNLATTPKGNAGNPIDRIVITADGDVVVNPDRDPVTLRIHRPERNRETAILTSFKANGRVQIRRVEIGKPDSCGDGYRCLRVRN